MESILSSEARASVVPGRDALDQLFAPLSLSDFLSRYWGKGHAFIHRRQRDYYKDLFTLDDLDRCFTIGISHPGVISTFIPPKGSDRKAMEGGITPASVDLAYKRFAAGDTIRLVSIDRLHAPIRELALRLQEAFGAKVHINSYLTPASSQGFSVHFDYNDSLILQVSGSKHWLVYEPEHEAPVDLPFARYWKASPEDPSSLSLREEAVLEAGDLLYVPRGFYHEAKTSNEHSLHLTVSLDPVYWITVLQKGLELVCKDLPELRQALPRGFPAKIDAQEDLAETFRSLFRVVSERASFDKTVRALLVDQLSSTQHAPDGHFSDLVQLEEIGFETLVERRAGMVPIVEVQGGNAILQFGSNHVSGPAAILPALEFVRDQKIFKAADLPGGLTDSSRVVLVRRMVREGLLKLYGR